MLTGYLRTIYEETMGQVPLGPQLGKQNKQAKEVYSGYKINKKFDGKIYLRTRTFNVKVHINPAWLAQLVKRRSAELEATGSSPGRTNTQGV